MINLIENKLAKLEKLIKTNVVYYESALKQLETYIEMIDNELKTIDNKTPINYIKTRIKSPKSILEKLHRKNLKLDINGVDKLCDIVGARIVVDFIDNIYVVIEKLKENKNIKIIEEKDYIKNPKKSGYRGYHLIIEMPIYVEGNKKNIKCEIQVRTLAIDTWASNEHKLNYKKDSIDINTKKVLKETSEEIWKVDLKLNELYKENANITKNKNKSSIFVKEIFNTRKNELKYS